MRRVADFLFRNWHLKLGAILVASVLYSGLVLGQNVRTWNGTVPIEVIGQSREATLLTELGPVSVVRYRAPLDIGVISPSSFRATIDLSRVEVSQAGPPQEVAVTLIALDRRIEIVDYQPQTLQVSLDPVSSRSLPVTVDVGAVPDGLNLSPAQTDPSSVTISGASSRVNQVSAVIARVAIDASAINIDRSFELVPIDASGNQVPNVELNPERVRVRIAVARELANRTVPVAPQVVGQPAAGYAITSVTVEPLVVSLIGDESLVTQLESAQTEPIDVAGRTDDLEALVRVALPAGVSVSGDDAVRVMITIAPQTGSRTFFAPVTLQGTRPGYTYDVDSTQIQVIATGPVAALEQMNPDGFVVTIDVAALEAGSHAVDWSVVGDVPADVTLAYPADLRTVTVTPPAPTPSPIPSPSPNPSPASPFPTP